MSDEEEWMEAWYECLNAMSSGERAWVTQAVRRGFKKGYLIAQERYERARKQAEKDAGAILDVDG